LFHISQDSSQPFTKSKNDKKKKKVRGGTYLFNPRPARIAEVLADALESWEPMICGFVVFEFDDVV